MQSYAHFFYLTVGMNAGNSLEDSDKKERKTKRRNFTKSQVQHLGGNVRRPEQALSFERKSCHRRYEPSS